MGSECCPGRHAGCHLWVLLHTGRSTPTSTANETSESWRVIVTAREKGLRCRLHCSGTQPLVFAFVYPGHLPGALPPTFPACLLLCVSRSRRCTPVGLACAYVVDMGTCPCKSEHAPCHVTMCVFRLLTGLFQRTVGVMLRTGSAGSGTSACSVFGGPSPHLLDPL